MIALTGQKLSSSPRGTWGLGTFCGDRFWKLWSVEPSQVPRGEPSGRNTNQTHCPKPRQQQSECRIRSSGISVSLFFRTWDFVAHRAAARSLLCCEFQALKQFHFKMNDSSGQGNSAGTNPDQAELRGGRTGLGRYPRLRFRRINSRNRSTASLSFSKRCILL